MNLSSIELEDTDPMYLASVERPTPIRAPLIYRDFDLGHTYAVIYRFSHLAEYFRFARKGPLAPRRLALWYRMSDIRIHIRSNTYLTESARNAELPPIIENGRITTIVAQSRVDKTRATTRLEAK